jgi:DNA-binding transcriptional ArsR family regulator
MTDEELDAAIRTTWEGNVAKPPLDPPATREEILRQLQEHPPGFTSLELQARLALSGPVVDGHLRALYKEGAVERRP